MATFKKKPAGWQVQIAIKGTREAKTFSTKAEATSWAAERETEIRKQHVTGVDLSKTVGDAFDRYAAEVSIRKKKPPTWERNRLNAILEVFDGGWTKEEEVRLGYTEQQREWIIVTAGACVSVFSKHEPEIRDAIWPAKV